MARPSDQISKLRGENAALRRMVVRLKACEQRYRESEAALEKHEERNRLLGDSSPLGMCTIDAQGWVTGLNLKMQEIFRWLSVDDPQSANLFRSPSLADSGMIADLQRCICQRAAMVVEHAFAHPHRGRFHLRCYLSPVPAGDGTVSGVLVIVEDNTDLKQTTEAFKESERRYRQLFQSAPIAMIEWNVSRLKAYLNDLHQSGIVDFNAYLIRHPQEVRHCWSLIETVNYNQAFLRLMGVSGGDRPGGAFIPTDSEEFLKMARSIIIVAAAGSTVDEREETLVALTGEKRMVYSKSIVVSGHEDTWERVIIALVDISKRKEAEQALKESEQRFREQALRDGLTGLYNQRYLYQSLAVDIERAESTNTSVSLIFLDLDHFKTVVDTHGHINGSRAIQKVARTIDSCLDAPAYAVAYAGDEFVVVLPGQDKSQALEKASEIRSLLNSTVFVLDRGVQVKLHASFGTATFPQDAADLNELIANADQALFGVKAGGKNAIRSFRDA